MNLNRSFSYLIQKTKDERPFFIFLTVILFGEAGFAAFASASLHRPLNLAVFLVLIICHIFLYWAAPVLATNMPRSFAYIAFQGLLAFILNLLGQNVTLIFGLYLSLIGISAGLFRFNRILVGVVAGLLVLSLFSYGLVEGWDSLVWWAIAIIPMMVFVIIYVGLYSRQTAARARAQALAEELEAANRRLAEYSGRVEELTLANERQRMARELHDTLSQGLAGLILKLEAADAHLEGGRAERARAILQQTLLQARATLADARRAIDDLRAARPSQDSLGEILRAEVVHFTESTGLACALEVDPALSLPPLAAETLRLVAAEALHNIARHARARAVEINVSIAQGQLEAVFRDDGAGFDPASVSRQTGHYGLLGMSERARLAGGKLEVLSQPGQGSTLVLSLPLEPASAERIA